MAPHKFEFKCMKAYQDGLGICEVKGRLEGGQEAGRNDVFVDEVWEADHATLPTWCTESTMTPLSRVELLHTIFCSSLRPLFPNIWVSIRVGQRLKVVIVINRIVLMS